MTLIDEYLQSAKKVGITGHLRPDGDCTGSTLGLYNYITANMPDIEVNIFLQPIMDEFHFLANSDMIKHESDGAEYDVFFVLDCAAFDRFPDFEDLFVKAKRTVVIDHHVSGQPIGTINRIMPDVSSCSELVYGILDPLKITKEVAECLYVGIIHDTGVFKYQNVSAKTMEIAGKLMETGIDFTNIIDNSFYMRTYRQSQVLGKALLESILFCDGKCVFSVITKAEMDFYGVEGKDLGGIVEQLRLNDGIEVAIFLYESEKDEYKVSLRSKTKVDVSKIAKMFGGGGHVRAAGFSMSAANPRDIINNIGAQIELQL